MISSNTASCVSQTVYSVCVCFTGCSICHILPQHAPIRSIPAAINADICWLQFARWAGIITKFALVHF